MKRLFDLLLSLIALLLLWPVILVVGVVIHITSQGPAVFAQARAGRHGRAFTIYKFRTMRIDSDPYGASPKSGEDPRLTRVGKWLRETSLDELPQLLNVIMGDMSLVGPRPLYVSQMAEWDEHQLKRLDVKPGLTGLAQTSGRGDLTVEEKLALDVEYTQTQSWLLDFQILWRTLWQVFGRHAIYEARYSRGQVTRGVNLPESEHLTR